MTFCPTCGQPVRFYTSLSGQRIPAGCRCGGGQGGSWATDAGFSSSALYQYDSSCWPTSCPQCGADVYFVRHNGGSVWFDDLGWPWPVHACMSHEGSKDSIRQLVQGAQVGDLGIVLRRVSASDRTTAYALLAVSLNGRGLCIRVDPRFKARGGSLIIVHRNSEGKIGLSNGSQNAVALRDDVPPHLLGMGQAFLETGTHAYPDPTPRTESRPDPEPSWLPPGRQRLSEPIVGTWRYKRCDYCGQTIRADRYAKHLRKAHGRS